MIKVECINIDINISNYFHANSFMKITLNFISLFSILNHAMKEWLNQI